MTTKTRFQETPMSPSTRPRPLRVLLVDDEAGFREIAAEHLESVGMEVEQAESAGAAMAILKARAFDVAVFDLKMPGADGLNLLARVKPETPEMEILMLTAHGGVETAVEAMQQGAHHFLLKPVKLAELQAALERAGEKAALNRMREGRSAVQDYRGRYRYREFLALGSKSKLVLETAARAAPGAFPVLIEGETGTGKELIAQYVHASSLRRGESMISVNCGLFSENLLERELFGHVKGAFTGAGESRAGLFEAADGGTLFLDEIGEASRDAQVALLRAIETGVFRRIGDVRERFADVRVVAASNRPLEAAVKSGGFRADLFHRLNVVTLLIPPLRDRPDEILPLATAFLARSHPALSFDDGALKALVNYSWPGNVRELQNVIERAVFMRTDADGKIGAAELFLSRAPVDPLSPPSNLDEAERAHIQATLHRLNGDKSAAAECLGITLRHLYRKIKKYKLAV